jgi:hypothetical protein
VSSKLLEERQAEMRERMLQEGANRKKQQFALERKDVSFDTAADEPQAELPCAPSTGEFSAQVSTCRSA